MPLELPIFANPESPHWSLIQECVHIVNGLQTQFVFELISTKLPNDKKAEVDLHEYDVSVRRFIPKTRPGVVITDALFKGPLLVGELLPDLIYVSCQTGDELDDPRLDYYLLYQLAAAALTLGGRLNEAINQAMIHNPPIGCLWDWWQGPKQQSAAMAAARICPICSARLKSKTHLRAEHLHAVQEILEFVRRSLCGQNPGIPRTIFIAYGGKNQDWKTLAQMLGEWNLQVDYFNHQPAAGQTTVERWMEMLNHARFASPL